MFAKVENGTVTKWPVNEDFIRAENPNTSFALPLSQETLTEFGYVRFQHTIPPTFDLEFQEAKEAAPLISGDAAVQVWRVLEKFTDAEKAAYIADRDARRLEEKTWEMRSTRASLLLSSDWTQLADSPLTTEQKSAWAAYRQALRDVPSQAGFPWTVTWPEQPA